MEKPLGSLQKALIVVVPMSALQVLLTTSAVCVFIPVPLMVQDTGTVIDTLSTTSSAETKEEARVRAEIDVTVVRAKAEYKNRFLLDDI